MIGDPGCNDAGTGCPNGGNDDAGLAVSAAAGVANDTGTNTDATNATAAATLANRDEDREIPQTERPTRASENTHHSPRMVSVTTN